LIAKTGKIRVLACAALLPALMAFLSGCWDEHELNELFFVTGIALDAASDPDKIDIALEIEQLQSDKSNGSSSTQTTSSQGSDAILLKAERETVEEGIGEIDINSTRRIFIHHNQVLLVGIELAEQGLENNLDLFTRNTEARADVPLLIVDGRADKLLSIDVEQETIAGVYVARVSDRQSTISEYYKVRILDFISKYIDGTTAPVIPVIKLVNKNNKDEIEFSGMAVFIGGKMIGRLSDDETLGYIWAMGGVSGSVVTARSDSMTASLYITSLNVNREITVRQDGGVSVKLAVNASLEIKELIEFDAIPVKELIPILTDMVQKAIADRIINTFEAVREMDADIYGYGVDIHRKYPNEWDSGNMKERWPELFSDIDFKVSVKAAIPTTGKAIQSMEMEEYNGEN